MSLAIALGSALALCVGGVSPSLALQVSARANVEPLPIVVLGKNIAPLLGQSPINLSAFSCREGRARPILFQVDEINAEGRKVPLEPTTRIAKDEKPGAIDETDEVIFLVRDVGDPCPPEPLAKAVGTLVTVQVKAEYLKEPGYVYFLASDKGFMPPDRLVQYDAATDTVRTEGYMWGYEKEKPFLYTRMGYTDIVGRSQEDVLDRLKIRARVVALGNLLRLNLTEQNFESTFDGVRIGPLRVTREVSVDIKTIPGFTIHTLVGFEHYPRLWRARVRFKIPAQAALFLSSLDVTLIHDFIDLRGTTLYTANLPQGALVDGKMVEQERHLALGKEPWFMLSGLGLMQMTVLDYDPGLNLTTAALFIDGTDQPDPPEEFPGGLPAVGYQFLGWENLQARWYSLGADIVTLKSFPEGGGAGYYRTLHTPAQVTVSVRTAH